MGEPFFESYCIAYILEYIYPFIFKSLAVIIAPSGEHKHRKINQTFAVKVNTKITETQSRKCKKKITLNCTCNRKTFLCLHYFCIQFARIGHKNKSFVFLLFDIQYLKSRYSVKCVFYITILTPTYLLLLLRYQNIRNGKEATVLNKLPRTVG